MDSIKYELEYELEYEPEYELDIEYEEDKEEYDKLVGRVTTSAAHFDLAFFPALDGGMGVPEESGRAYKGSMGVAALLDSTGVATCWAVLRRRARERR